MRHTLRSITASACAPSWNVFDVIAVYISTRSRAIEPAEIVIASRSSAGNPGGGVKCG